MRLFGRFFTFVSIVAALMVIFGMAGSLGTSVQDEPIIDLVMKSAWLAIALPVMVVAWLLGMIMDRA